MANLSETLRKIAHSYPKAMVDEQLQDIPRAEFHIELVCGSALPKPPSELSFCDIGGGIGLFPIGCAAHGLKRTVLIDDFDDPVNHDVGNSILDLHRAAGVEVYSRDVVADGIDDIEGTFDVISTFDSMEHWHHSPKKLFSQVVRKLKTGGVFILGVPNCVNLRKRVTVPFGRGKWSGMATWYEAEKFRGHVREPDVGDLRYIARDMGLKDVTILGRNWAGLHSANPLIRLVAQTIDFPLRLRPSLCSNLYMIGRTQ